MKTRRIFAAVLAVLMLLSVVPMTAFGITTNDVDTKGTTTGPYSDSELYLGKTATLENDGTYTIRLEAFATGNPVTTQLRSGLPLDIVLVLDQSGSMYQSNYLETLRDSVDEFIDVIAANGRTIGVTHRVAIVGYASDSDDGTSTNVNLAGGSAEYYVNTGVFLEDGTFKNYGEATTSYLKVEGTPVPGHTYYIIRNDEFVALTMSASYSAVENPSTDRTDLYAIVNGTYLPALYADNEYYEVTNPDASKTYYIDVDGVKTPITATVTGSYTYTRTYTVSQSNGQVYYIDTDTSSAGENWVAVTCSGSNGNWTWTGSDGNTYSRSGSNNYRYFTRNGTTYYAHTRSGNVTTTWTTANGTVVDIASETVYDLLSGWVYLQNGAFYPYTGTLYEVSSVTWKYGNTNYDPATTQFYEKGTAGGLTNDDYRDALMPVTDGEAGAGSVTAALETAVSKIAASGATRTSLGLEMAKKVLENRIKLADQDKRQTVVIVFTDGEPGRTGFTESEANSALAVSAQLKDADGSYNATVYTIGLYETAVSNVTRFMHGLSSNYPSATEMGDVPESPTGKHYMHASDKEQLYDIFPEIITDSTTTTLDQKWLTADTVVRDILQKGFVLTNGTTITMSSLAGTSSNRNITWADTETVIDTLTITNAAAAEATSEKEFLKAYNQGGTYSVEATGFDFNEYFFGTSNPTEGTAATHATGAKLIITISRVEATDGVTWNMTELTNDPYSGVWSPVLSDGTRSQIGVFPQPNTYFTDTVAVLDYAKTTGDLAAELRQSGIKHLDADGMNFFETAATKLHDTYGNIEFADGELTYTPNTMVWNNYETFYVFGNTDDDVIIRHSANEVNENVWSKVTVIPANNVYYEDTFVTSESDGRVGIEFSENGWTLADEGTNVENPEDAANGDVQGWEDSLSDDIGYSDGTAAVGGNGATATFTFAGTGVDIYSRTNMQTGLIAASIYEGTTATGVPLRTLVVDNFAKSGDYYMIPTLSIHTKPLRENGETVFDKGRVVYTDLGYGIYTVQLTVVSITDDADFDGTDTTRSTYYLDGIRVYNPLNNEDAVVEGAYGEGELNVAFAEVRDILLDANTFVEGSEGVVFIDQVLEENEDGEYVEVTGNSTTAIGVYDAIGPENEVYLSNDQMIAFKPASGAPYFVGLKSPTGAPVTVTITGADGGMELLTISHTTDLFYPIGVGDGVVSISNTSGALLSVTKIKAAVTTEGQTLINAIGHDEALVAAEESFAAAAVLSKNNEAVKNPEDTDSILELRPSDVIFDFVFRIFDGMRDWFV